MLDDAAGSKTLTTASQDTFHIYLYEPALIYDPDQVSLLLQPT